MKTPARISLALCLVAACDMSSTELGSTRVAWTWVSPDDAPIDAVATTPDDEIVVILSSEDQSTGVLRKHAPDGGIAWSRDAAVRLADVAVEPAGTIVALGSTADDAWWLYAHAPDGTPQWEQPLPAGTHGAALAALDDGTILVAVNAGDAAELRGYSATGIASFTRPLAADELEVLPRVGALATSPAGHVAAAGHLDEGAWAARLTAAGEVLWLHRSATDSLDAIAIDDGGAPFVVGRLDTDETQGTQLVLRRLDAAGAIAWERTEPGRHAHAAAIGEDGTLYWAGTDHADALVVALEPDGTERWIERSSGPHASPDEDYAIGLALAPTGELVAAGALDYRRAGGSGAWFRGWLGRYETDE